MCLSVVSLSVHRGFHVIIIHDALDLTIQGPTSPSPRHGTSLYRVPLSPMTWDLTVEGSPSHPAPSRHGTSLYRNNPDMFKLVQLEPHHTGTPSTDMFNLFHYEAHTVSKWAVPVLLECFLLLYTVHKNVSHMCPNPQNTLVGPGFSWTPIMCFTKLLLTVS